MKRNRERVLMQSFDFHQRQQEQSNGKMKMFRSIVLEEFYPRISNHNSYLTPCTKTNPRRVSDVNARAKTMKMLEKLAQIS